MTGVWLEELSWFEAKGRFDSGAVVVIPIGAIAKEHGPHLPLNTDWVIARELARRVSESLPVVIAPIVAFGYYPAFAGYAGSQHLTAPTFMSLMDELMGNLIGQGARHIAIINTGVSTEAPLSIVCRGMLERHGISIPTAGMSRLGRTSDKLLQQKVGGHADEHETSIMPAIDPSRVTLSRVAVDYGDALDRPANVFHRPGYDERQPKRRLWRSEPARPGKERSHPGGHDRGTAGRLKASFPEALGSRGK